MSVKAEIKRLSDRLDALNHQENQAHNRRDVTEEQRIQKLKAPILHELDKLKHKQGKELSAKAQQIKKLAFSRPITKEEQSDMGALKKKARGLVVVHPTSKLGREMGVSVMTGYARKPF